MPTGPLEVFFVPLPDHSSTPTSCAIVTHEGELESSADYSRAQQLVSAKEIGRSVGFVTCDPVWAEIVFLASQEVLYDYFGNSIGRMDLNLQFGGDQGLPQNSRNRTIQVRVLKRFYIAENLAVRRCRLNRKLLTSHRARLSKSGYYDKKPRLAESERRTANIQEIAEKFREFSGQHTWQITVETVRQFINQFPPQFREDAKSLLLALNFLNRDAASNLLQIALRLTIEAIKTEKGETRIHIVPLAGTSAHMMLELLKQEFRQELKAAGIKDHKSVHAMLGVAQAGDEVIFVDDNISSGTQFSAQLLRWVGLQNTSTSPEIRKEVGIELFELDNNAKLLLRSLNLRLATCVGKDTGNASVRENLLIAGDSLNFCGVIFGRDLALNPSGVATSAPIKSEFLNFLKTVGEECMRSAADLEEVDDSCRSKALGYGNSQGRTITLWNVPTSTFTALWCPGIVDGEPWFPLFIRRGYADKLVVA